ncbi:MAG: hypothetical protein KDC52_16815, partial [Ignavibacteriae bacterium]|nr:hypothetical protein [Ignavibacteriota bacterium]
MASSSEDKILLSQFKKYVIFTRQSDNLEIEEFFTFGKMIIKEIITDKIIILPSTEFLNRFILKNRVQLENNNFVVPLCNSELYNKISDKFSFSKLCNSHEINIPREYDKIENVSFPFVIKPKKYFGDNNLVNKKPQIITTKLELSDLVDEQDNSKYYYQEFIGGKSFY